MSASDAAVSTRLRSAKTRCQGLQQGQDKTTTQRQTRRRSTGDFADKPQRPGRCRSCCRMPPRARPEGTPASSLASLASLAKRALEGGRCRRAFRADRGSLSSLHSRKAMASCSQADDASQNLQPAKTLASQSRYIYRRDRVRRPLVWNKPKEPLSSVPNEASAPPLARPPRSKVQSGTSSRQRAGGSRSLLSSHGPPRLAVSIWCDGLSRDSDAKGSREQKRTGGI